MIKANSIVQILTLMSNMSLLLSSDVVNDLQFVDSDCLVLVNAEFYRAVEGTFLLVNQPLSNECASDGEHNAVAGLPLVNLDVGQTRMTDEGLAVIAHMTTLRAVAIDRTNITGAGVEERRILPPCVIGLASSIP